MAMSSCICELMETAQSMGNDTHAEVTWLIGHESTGQAWPCRPLSVGRFAWLCS